MNTLISGYSRVIGSACLAIGLAITLLSAFLPQVVGAQTDTASSAYPYRTQTGEAIYIPVYSYIFQGEKSSKQPLSSTLIIHNADPSNSITIHSVRYYDHAGIKIKDYIDAPRALGPFASLSFVVDIKEDRGGVGANFIVEWRSENKVISPIIEAIMSGGTGTQGLSFVTRGKVIEALP